MKDILAEIDGAVLLKNVDGMSMGWLARKKEELEEKYKVSLDLDARSARIWSKNGDRNVIGSENSE